MMKKTTKKRRVFSESFKKEKVSLYEKGELRRIDLERMYELSTSVIHSWIKKYGTLPSSERIVIETDSDFIKSNSLQKRIYELERKLGSQLMELDYYKRVISKATEHYEEDIEKKFSKL